MPGLHQHRSIDGVRGENGAQILWAETPADGLVRFRHPRKFGDSRIPEMLVGVDDSHFCVRKQGRRSHILRGASRSPALMYRRLDALLIDRSDSRYRLGGQWRESRCVDVHASLIWILRTGNDY